MTDLDMTKMCAEAMGISVVSEGPQSEPPQLWLFKSGVEEWSDYDPLHDDAQAMELVKKCEMIIRAEMNTKTGEKFWSAMQPGKPHWVKNGDLNRAIVECVAKMQAAKK